MSGPLLLPFGLPDFLHSLQTRVRPICIVEHLFYNGSSGQGQHVERRLFCPLALALSAPRHAR